MATKAGPPLTLDQIRDIPDPAERARAVGKFLDRIETAARDARTVRRGAIAQRLLEPNNGPTKVAGECGVSVSLVKNVRDGKATVGEALASSEAKAGQGR